MHGHVIFKVNKECQPDIFYENGRFVSSRIKLKIKK